MAASPYWVSLKLASYIPHQDKPKPSALRPRQTSLRHGCTLHAKCEPIRQSQTHFPHRFPQCATPCSPQSLLSALSNKPLRSATASGHEEPLFVKDGHSTKTRPLFFCVSAVAKKRRCHRASFFCVSELKHQRREGGLSRLLRKVGHLPHTTT
jgi:hypothetical protein